MDNFDNIPPCPGISPLAIFILELGKAIQAHRPTRPFGKVTDPKPGDPDEQPVTTLLKRTSPSRKLFTYMDGAPDPIEVRAFAVTAFLQTMTDTHPNIRLISELVGQEDCGRVLEARLALFRLCKKGALSLRDSPEKKWNSYVSLSSASVALMGLRKKELPLLFTSGMVAPPASPDRSSADPLAKIPSPVELADKVNHSVLGMGAIVASLSIHIVMHMKRAKLIRDGKDVSGLGNTCICLIGESGCGKTFAIHELGKASGLPFGSNASPDFSITGFVGLNSEDALRPVLAAAGNNPAIARHGICFMDEWDKLRPMDSSGSTHVSTTGVVHSFLRLMEGGDVICNAKRSSSWNEQPINMSTVGTCFAFSGVFKGLQQELKIADKGMIGFVTDGGKKGKMIQDAMTCWGMPREWVNRLSVIQFVPPPTLGLLMRVAADENGVIAAYNRLLVEEGKSFSLTEAAVRELASYALESKGYARVVKMGIAKCCELVMGGGQKGRTEFSLVEIRKVIDSMGDGG